MKNNDSSKWVVGFGVITVIVGYDSEYADMDNPRGARFGERWFIQAEDELGYRRQFGGMYKTRQAAEQSYLAFAPPVEFWDEVEPCYGSEAYARNWREYEANQIAREREEDFQREMFGF